MGGGLDPARDFPLAAKRPDLVKTGSGKSLDQVTLEAVVKGEIKAEEIRITPRPWNTRPRSARRRAARSWPATCAGQPS